MATYLPSLHLIQARREAILTAMRYSDSVTQLHNMEFVLGGERAREGWGEEFTFMTMLLLLPSDRDSEIQYNTNQPTRIVSMYRRTFNLNYVHLTATDYHRDQSSHLRLG